MKNLKWITIFIVIVIVIFIFLIVTTLKNKGGEQHNLKRYEEIKKDIDNELERYLYVIAPKCQKDGGAPRITHKDLVYNAGMDKEKFLDVDGKSYCKAYVYSTCIETGKWSWKTTISCKNYQDEDYQDWDYGFESKK